MKTLMKSAALLVGVVGLVAALEGCTSDVGGMTSEQETKLEAAGAVILSQDQPREVSARSAEAALAEGRWVVASGVNGEAKRALFGDLVGAGSTGESRGYAVRRSVDRTGHLVVEIVDEPVGVQTGPLPTDVAPELGPSEGMIAELARRSAPRTDATLGESADLPPELQYATYYYAQRGDWTVGSAGRKGGHQDVGYEANYKFTVFLNNKNNPQGDFQLVLVDADIAANPTRGTGQFLNMAAHSGSDWVVYSWDEHAWFQDRLNVEVSPREDGPAWSLLTSSPQTENGETEVSTEVSFEVGFKKDGAEASFGFHSGESHKIKDWKLTNDSAGKGAAWSYRSAYPLDSDQWYLGRQAIYGDSTYLRKMPNDLSLTTMQLHTQAVWRTSHVVKDTVHFSTKSSQHMVDLYCANNFGFGCSDNQYKEGSREIPNDFAIDMGAVVPVAIQSVTFDHNPAVAGQPVVGTVKLAEPARMATNIRLASNSVNATVLPTITVPKGASEATFQVLTNANNLASKQSTVATVTAYYGEDFQAQLEVKAP